MAESPLDRLKRLAAEKKLAAAQPVVSTESETVKETLSKPELIELVTENTEANLEARFEIVKEELVNVESRESNAARNTETKELESQSIERDRQNSQLSSSVESPGDSGISSTSNTTSNHPLAMQFAELESALLATDPEFKTILRQIHRHLGQEPELVTQMTEQEIQMVVQGLVVFANAEIVAPAAAKSEKAKLTAAKKKVISADDL